MEVYIKLFARDLGKLITEVESFRDESNLWKVDGDIKNCSGNLCLHLIGNLNFFIGTIIGGTGYVRDREAEFSDKNVPRVEILKSIKETSDIITHSLQKMDQKRIKDTYPIDVFGDKMTYEFFIIHLIAHLNYHLGQVNYLRRIIES